MVIEREEMEKRVTIFPFVQFPAIRLLISVDHNLASELKIEAVVIS
jgi:hypothetical protein